MKTYPVATTALLLLCACPVFAGTYGLGEAIAVKDVKHTDPHRGTTLLKDATLTFESVEEHASIENQLLTTDTHVIKPVNGKFLVVRYSVKNNSDQVLDSWPLFFGGASLEDDKGNSYPISKVSGQFAQSAKLDMQGKRMNPGEGISSCVVFDVPEGSAAGSLTLDLIDAKVSLAGGEAKR